MEYQEAYYFLFNSISDLITKLEELQKKAEEIIINEASHLEINHISTIKEADE